MWTWTAIDADTKLMLAYEVGDRSADTGLEFLENLRERLASPVHLVMDGYKVYLSVVKQVFGENAEHLLLTEGASTSYVERQNLTMRMGMRRFARKTNGFSNRHHRPVPHLHVGQRHHHLRNGLLRQRAQGGRRTRQARTAVHLPESGGGADRNHGQFSLGTADHCLRARRAQHLPLFRQAVPISLRGRLGPIAHHCGPQWEYWGYMAIGGGIMGGLLLLRQQFVWWPLHPIGFPISLVIHKMFFTVLVAWLLKTAILQYGGPKLFSRLRPFFLGLILGDFFPLAFLLLLDQLAARL